MRFELLKSRSKRRAAEMIDLAKTGDIVGLDNQSDIDAILDLLTQSGETAEFFRQDGPEAFGGPKTVEYDMTEMLSASSHEIQVLGGEE